MTERKLAELTGLAHSTIALLMKRKTWKGCRLETVSALMTACGVDPWHPQKVVRWLRTATLAHLKHGESQQKKLALRLAGLVFGK